MSILKTTFVTTALIFGSTTTVFAQDAMVDKAKDMAVDKGVDVAKDKAKGMVGDDKAQYVDPAAKVGKKMLMGDSAKDAVIGAATSDGKALAKGAVMGSSMTDNSLSAEEAVTAGKVMMKGGSKEDAAMAVAKDRAKDKMMEKAGAMMSGDTAPMAAPATAPQAVINCPAGTTAQPNGTCMVTGDYKE